MAQRGINKVILIGNLGQDPDVRYTKTGDPVATLSLATSETWKDKSGTQQERTEWHRVVLYGKLAEVGKQYLHKGSKLYVEGQLRTRKWQDKEGQDRYITEVQIGMNGTIQMLDRKPADGGDSRPAPSQPSATRPPQSRDDDPFFDDEIPF